MVHSHCLPLIALTQMKIDFVVGNCVTLPRKLSQYQDSSQTPVCKPKERPLAGKAKILICKTIMRGRTQKIIEPTLLSVVFSVKGTGSRKFLVRLPTDYLPGKSHGQRSLVGYGPWGCKDTTERLHFHQLPGKPAEEHTPHGAFDQLSQWRCSDTKIRATSSRARVGTQAFTDQAQ